MKTSNIKNLIYIAIIAITSCSFKAGNVNSDPPANLAIAATATPTPETPAESAAAQSDGLAAAAIVADLYKQHDAKKSPFFQTKNRALVDKYFTKTTADLIWKDATSSAGEVGALDADPLYAAQDINIKNFSVGKAEVKGDNATVPVNFTNYTDKRTVTFLLKMVKGSWKIDDIKWGEGDTMVKMIKETYADQKDTSTAGEFEGRFRVGETSCTVKPVKMAFEIRWEKGSGVEMFFAKDGNSFESSPDKGPANRFVFDDENYNSGTFYRADGKSFIVKRAGKM